MHRLLLKRWAICAWASFLLLTTVGCQRAAPPPVPPPPAPNAATTPDDVATEPPPTVEPATAAADIAPPRAASPDDWYADITTESGLVFAYDNGRSGRQFTILESVGGGGAAFDYDNDGDLDVYLAGGGTIQAGEPLVVAGKPGALFRNEGAFHFVDVTQEAGLAEPADYSHGCATADYDHDGDADLFLTCYGQNRLYRNELVPTGEPRFVDVTADALPLERSWSTSAAWGDIDRDGWPDLFVANYLTWEQMPQECTNRDGARDVCPPNSYAPAADWVLRSRGDGTFENISQELGIRQDGKGMGVVATDLNADGWLDFYVANDVTDNHFYLGGAQRPWQEIGLAAGVNGNEFGVAEGSMGVDAGDFDRDGDLDLWTVNFELEDNSLYRQVVPGQFEHATVSAGLGGVGRSATGFGAAFVDADSDGWLDLCVANGHVFYSVATAPYLQTPLFLHNQNGRFDDIAAQLAPWFAQPHPARGLIVADFDDDGGSDLLVVLQEQPAAVLRNLRPPQHWLGVRLAGEQCDREAVGARVALVGAEPPLLRCVRGGGSYLSQGDQRLVFPLPADEPARVQVDWPDGTREFFGPLQPGEYHVLVQAQGASPAAE